MQDVLSMVAELKRPRLLVQAVRLGLEEYRREVHLPRLLGAAEVPLRPGAAILRLLELEAVMDGGRRRRAADYRVARHVAVLVALMGEAQLLRALAREA